MRLYHETGPRRAGAMGADDEEECYTLVGRRCGVWLTTEQLTGPGVVSTIVVATEVGPYEVSDVGAPYRSFVVPALVAGGWHFS